MTSERKSKGQAGGAGAGRRTLERLKPDEAAAVLWHLLKVHPDLGSEAEQIARSLLHQVDDESVAAELEDEIRALDYAVTFPLSVDFVSRARVDKRRPSWSERSVCRPAD